MAHLSEKILALEGSSPADIAQHFANLQALRERIHPRGVLAPDPKEYYVRCPDGVRIFCQEWMPAAPRALILCQHGNNVHGDIFYPLADDFYYRDFGVLAVDNRGHGRSGPVRGNLDKPAQMHAIYYNIFKQWGKEYPGVPCFFLGESLGSCIVTNFVSRYAYRCPNLVSAIFMVPPYRTRMENWIRLIIPLATPIILLFHPIIRGHPVVKLPQFYNNPSYFPEFNTFDRFDKMNNRKITVLNLLNFLAGIFPFRFHVPEVNLPALMVQGTGDNFVNPAGAQLMYKQLGSRMKKLIIYPHANHSLFMDQNSQGVFADIAAWVERWAGK
jgi:alpha-beta hydrolase superfamily lysophospholipase